MLGRNQPEEAIEIDGGYQQVLEVAGKGTVSISTYFLGFKHVSKRVGDAGEFLALDPHLH